MYFLCTFLCILVFLLFPDTYDNALLGAEGNYIYRKVHRGSICAIFRGKEVFDDKTNLIYIAHIYRCNMGHDLTPFIYGS